MKVVKTAAGKTTLSLTRADWQKIGEKRGWKIREEGKEYDPNMATSVSGDAGQPKCPNCGTKADRIVDAAVQEWACQKCKQVNRLKGAESLMFPPRLDETKDKSQAEKTAVTADGKKVLLSELGVEIRPVVKRSRTITEEYEVCPHCGEEIGEKASFFDETSRQAETVAGRIVFVHGKCGKHYDIGPMLTAAEFNKRMGEK
jgi:ribosomal protein L37AE/L43A/predicted RNA-binding Zn-ribbon protein involved in translation (DUF1610 family)